MTNQSYVSNELTHFVGRNKKTQEERFQLLLSILEEGNLVPGTPKIDIDPSTGEKCQRIDIVRINRGTSLSEEKLIESKTVCFCDIPRQDMRIHMEKYSYFGLSFLKTFLASNRCNPVMYVVSDAVCTIGHYNKESFFQRGATTCINALDGLQKIIALKKFGEDEDIQELYQILNHAILFLTSDVFPFFKFFKGGLEDSDEQNYYMEREWRILGSLNFELSDVVRVIIPKEYELRFRQAFPNYSGCLDHSDQ